MERFKSLALSLVTFMIGLGLVSTSFSNLKEASVGSFIFSLLIGAFCLFAGVFFFIILVLPAWKENDKSIKSEIKDFVKADQSGSDDNDEIDYLISGFRRSFKEFFSTMNNVPNSSLQLTSSQFYWHMLTLQKNRLKKQRVTLDFDAVRKSYDGTSVSKNVYFDGKYQITEAKERIESKRTYKCDNIKFVKLDTELANYNIINAYNNNSKGDVTCPSCGSVSTKENLLDGCDFCQTKFTIEDLNKKISNFALRSDYEIEYDKYKDKRKYYARRSALFGAIPFFILTFIIGIFTAIKDHGLVMGLVATFFGSAFMAFAMGYLFSVGFMFFIFPIIQVKHSAIYAFKGSLKKKKQSENKNHDFVKQIQKFDPYFSMEYFFSNIQNKVAAIHYAGEKDNIGAFSQKDLEVYVLGYSDVVDMDFKDFSIKSVSNDGNNLKVVLQAKIGLLIKSLNKFKTSKETVEIAVIKDAACKTEAVCEPFVLHCRNCNASLSLVEGGKCQYCGSVLELRKYDWVIDDYKVL